MDNQEREFVSFECECGASISVPASRTGQQETCKICGKKMTVPSPEPGGAAWYYVKNNRQEGPIPESKLQEMLDAGVIGPETLLWSKSLADWTPASRIKSFRLKTAPARTSKGPSVTCIVLAIVIPLIAVVMFVILGIIAAIAIPALVKAKESARRYTCVNNMKQMGMMLGLYAAENKDRLPGIDNVIGNLIFEGDALYPEYLTDFSILGCPSDSGFDPEKTFRLNNNKEHPGFSVGDFHPDCVTCESYIYLGWLVTNEEESLAAIDAYLNTSAVELSGNLNVPAGKGNKGGNIIRRMELGIDRIYVPDTLVDGTLQKPDIPVIWEWPTYHEPGGSNVLYLDGHVDFHRYPGDFPMTKRFTDALRNMEPEFSGDVLPIANK